MSRFRIYQIDNPDPKIAGQKMRRQSIIYTIMASLLVLIFSVGLMILKISLVFLFVIFAPLLGIFLYRLNKLGSTLKQIKTIGEIEFTRTCIRKKICDSITEYDYNTVKQIELQRHFPIVGISGTLSDNFTYILKVIFFNSPSESLVVSNLPIDNRLNISIVETMQTLKKINELEIIIKI